MSPPRVTAGQEVMWYLAYRAALWLIVSLIGALIGSGFFAVPRRTQSDWSQYVFEFVADMGKAVTF